MTGDFPITRLAEEDFFDRMAGQTRSHPTDIVFGVETLAGEHVGLTGIHRIEWRHGVATSGTAIGAPHRGQGYGSDAARTRFRYAFDVLGLRLLISEVMADNHASLRMLQKAGDTEAGRIPAATGNAAPTATRSSCSSSVQRDCPESRPHIASVNGIVQRFTRSARKPNREAEKL